jgi:hypothetical protein
VKEESALSTILAAPVTVACDEFACREATSHPATCRCACGGDGHGIRAQVDSVIAASRFQTRADVRPSGFTSAMFAAIPDDEAW